jgi:hypothetical protein
MVRRERHSHDGDGAHPPVFVEAALGCASFGRKSFGVVRRAHGRERKVVAVGEFGKKRGQKGVLEPGLRGVFRCFSALFPPWWWAGAGGGEWASSQVGE